ncbi:MAG TPA: cupredoxin domain-containing protein, partial [Candidatus Eisenbacteria bacterium]|nr:cupredoxin domain-containing protein [Candidatus Eisenbacteria bacterium]
YLGTPSGSGAPSGSLPPTAETLELTAEAIAFDKKTLEAPADEPFGIDFVQKDSGVGGHNVEIRDSSGTSLFKGAVLTDPGETTYVVSPLAAGTYTFICTVHPIPNMTGTLTVK